jgi:hypothetical protein
VQTPAAFTRAVRVAMPSLLGVAVTASATACQEDLVCTSIGWMNPVTVTLQGDDSHVDRVFACSTEVTDCVPPKGSALPLPEQSSSGWTTWMNPNMATPDQIDVYVVDAKNRVLVKQRVSVTWVRDDPSNKCGGVSQTTATITLPAA